MPGRRAGAARVLQRSLPPGHAHLTWQRELAVPPPGRPTPARLTLRSLPGLPAGAARQPVRLLQGAAGLLHLPRGGQRPGEPVLPQLRLPRGPGAAPWTAALLCRAVGSCCGGRASGVAGARVPSHLLRCPTGPQLLPDYQDPATAQSCVFQVELGPIRKANEGTPGGAARKQPAAGAAAGQSPLTPGALAAAAGGRSKLAGTPQSGAKLARSALRDANAH